MRHKLFGHNMTKLVIITWSKFICDFGLISSAVQERLTKQIAMALVEAVNPAGVGVVIEAT